MISLQRSMHSSQMYTPGPAISFLTCFWLFPQNEHFSRSPPSPMRATGATPHDSGRWTHVRDPAPTDGVLLLFFELEGTPSHPRMGQDTATPCPAARIRSDRGGGALQRLEDRVDQAVLHRRLRGQDLVPLDVRVDLLRRLAG